MRTRRRIALAVLSIVWIFASGAAAQPIAYEITGALHRGGEIRIGFYFDPSRVIAVTPFLGGTQWTFSSEGLGMATVSIGVHSRQPSDFLSCQEYNGRESLVMRISAPLIEVPPPGDPLPIVENWLSLTSIDPDFLPGCQSLPTNVLYRPSTIYSAPEGSLTLGSETLTFTVMSFGRVGHTQQVPLLPTLIDPAQPPSQCAVTAEQCRLSAALVCFCFTSVPTDQWVDPPAAYGYEYTMTSNSRFTRVLDLPAGFQGPFTVSTGGTSLGLFGPGQSVDFSSLSGGGVTSFTITGINPAVDASNPTAFPVKLQFSSQTASFSMVPITTPSVIAVAIDIKPGSFPNTINLGSNGVVPVAILSTPSFNASTVNPMTVTLSGAAVKLRGQGTPMASLEDVNGDRLLDLVVHVSTSALELSSTDVQAVLEGYTLSGTPIRGIDSIRVVP